LVYGDIVTNRRSVMSAEDRLQESGPEGTTREHSFDELAKGLVNDTILVNVMQAADAYIKKGISITPCDYKDKIPLYRTLFKDPFAWHSNWGKYEQITGISSEEVPLYFFGNGYNIGICNGKNSNGLVDVDLDCPEAVAVAQYILPPTLKSGREGKVLTHYWYLIDGPIPETRWFRLPAIGRSYRRMVVELRSTGTCTLVPPSIYPEGERCVWGGDKLFCIYGDKLVEYVDDVAVASLMLMHYPDATEARPIFEKSVASYLSSRLAPQRVKRIISGAIRASEYREGTDTPFLVEDLEAIVEKIVTGKRVKGVRKLERIAPSLAKILVRWFQWYEQPRRLLQRRLLQQIETGVDKQLTNHPGKVLSSLEMVSASQTVRGLLS